MIWLEKTKFNVRFLFDVHEMHVWELLIVDML